MKKSSIAAVAVLAALVTAGSGASQAQFRPAADTSAGSALVNCGTTQTIGVAYPATGPAASIGVYQIHWAQFFASQWNKTHKRNKIRIVQGDTKLPDTASALSVAHQFASNSNILGLVGPAGSQEVQDTAAVFKSGRSRHRLWLGDSRHAHACARREAARHAQGLLLPDGPERRAAGRPCGSLDRWRS